MKNVSEGSANFGNANYGFGCLIMSSFCRGFEIITSDLQLFDFCSLLLLAQGQAALSFLSASGLGERRGEGGHLAQV